MRRASRSPSPGPAVGQYTSPVAKRCCQDGLTRLPMQRTCEKRAARVQQPACREPFLSCCQFAESLRKKARTRGQVGLARGDQGDRVTGRVCRFHRAATGSGKVWDSEGQRSLVCSVTKSWT